MSEKKRLQWRRLAPINVFSRFAQYWCFTINLAKQTKRKDTNTHTKKKTCHLPQLFPSSAGHCHPPALVMQGKLAELLADSLQEDKENLCWRFPPPQVYICSWAAKAEQAVQCVEARLSLCTLNTGFLIYIYESRQIGLSIFAHYQ